MKRILHSKFPADCTECDREIEVGEVVVWDADSSDVWCRQCAIPDAERDTMSELESTTKERALEHRR